MSVRALKPSVLILALLLMSFLGIAAPTAQAGPKPPTEPGGVQPATVGTTCRLTAFVPTKSGSTVTGKSNFSCSQNMTIVHYVTLLRMDGPFPPCCYSGEGTEVGRKEYHNFTASANLTYYAEPTASCRVGTHKYYISTWMNIQYSGGYIEDVWTYGGQATFTC